MARIRGDYLEKFVKQILRSGAPETWALEESEMIEQRVWCCHVGRTEEMGELRAIVDTSGGVVCKYCLDLAAVKVELKELKE